MRLNYVKVPDRTVTHTIETTDYEKEMSYSNSKHVGNYYSINVFEYWSHIIVLNAQQYIMDCCNYYHPQHHSHSLLLPSIFYFTKRHVPLSYGVVMHLSLLHVIFHIDMSYPIIDVAAPSLLFSLFHLLGLRHPITLSKTYDNYHLIRSWYCPVILAWLLYTQLMAISPPSTTTSIVCILYRCQWKTLHVWVISMHARWRGGFRWYIVALLLHPSGQK